MEVDGGGRLRRLAVAGQLHGLAPLVPRIGTSSICLVAGPPRTLHQLPVHPQGPRQRLPPEALGEVQGTRGLDVDAVVAAPRTAGGTTPATSRAQVG
jgi:hypothetical protein